MHSTFILAGLITSKVAIDYETIPYKTFLLTNTGSDSLMVDTTNITLNIQNMNEPPKFTKTKYAFTAIENSVSKKYSHSLIN